jgi:hypothetical protein
MWRIVMIANKKMRYLLKTLDLLLTLFLKININDIIPRIIEVNSVKLLSIGFKILILRNLALFFEN